MLMPFRLLCLLIAAATLVHCAVVGRPTGGKVDVAGPILDTLRSTPNFTTNFSEDELVLEFNEYIQLKNAVRNIVLTPTPLAGRPRYIQRGRQVRIDLSEVELRDSTTYQIQFGEAIQDLNEGNPATRLKYVFSTGTYLDSLAVRGEVIGSLDAQPVADVLVGLYRSPSDTALTLSAPDYFTRTDSTGRFVLDYLAQGSYQLVAYTDQNANYRLNQGAEEVAFLDTTIQVMPFAPDTLYTLTLSAERPPLIVLRGEQLFPGLIRFTLNQPALPEVAVRDIPGQIVSTYRSGDSLYVAYTPGLDTLASAVVELEGEIDSVSLRQNLTDRPTELRVNAAAVAVPGEAAVNFRFNLPLRSFDESEIRVSVDTVTYPVGQWMLDTVDARLLRWRPPADTVPSFSVSWLPGAITTVFDSTNRDTLRAAVRPRRRSEFGEIALTLGGLDSTGHYVLELIDEKGNTERSFLLGPRLQGTGPREEVVKLARVAGGNYSVRITEDLNADGRYSPGDRRLRRQPERVRVYPLQQVRADWQTEQRIDYFTSPGSKDALHQLIE